MVDAVDYQVNKDANSINVFKANPGKTSFYDAYIGLNPFETTKSSAQRLNITLSNATSSDLIKSKVVYTESTKDEYRGSIEFGGQGPILVEVKYQKYRNGDWDTIDRDQEELPYK